MGDSKMTLDEISVKMDSKIQELVNWKYNFKGPTNDHDAKLTYLHSKVEELRYLMDDYEQAIPTDESKDFQMNSSKMSSIG